MNAPNRWLLPIIVSNEQTFRSHASPKVQATIFKANAWRAQCNLCQKLEWKHPLGNRSNWCYSLQRPTQLKSNQLTMKSVKISILLKFAKQFIRNWSIGRFISSLQLMIDFQNENGNNWAHQSQRDGIFLHWNLVSCELKLTEDFYSRNGVPK